MSTDVLTETDSLERVVLDSLADDEEYWDHLDELEHLAGGCREWDNATAGGAS